MVLREVRVPAFSVHPQCPFGVHCVRTRKRVVPGVFGSRLKTPFLCIRLAVDKAEVRTLRLKIQKSALCFLRVFIVKGLDQDLASILRTRERKGDWWTISPLRLSGLGRPAPHVLGTPRTGYEPELRRDG